MSIWVYPGLHLVLGVYLGLFGVILVYLGVSLFIWDYLGSCRFNWIHLNPSGFISFHLGQFGPVTSNRFRVDLPWAPCRRRGGPGPWPRGLILVHVSLSAVYGFYSCLSWFIWVDGVGYLGPLADSDEILDFTARVWFMWV